MIVLDSSAAVEMLRGTEASNAIRKALHTDEKIVSCRLLGAEVASVMRKFSKTEGISPIEADWRLNDAMKLVDEFYAIEDLQAEALAESIRLDHSVYDMFYFVLARRTRGTLFTVDQQLLRLSEQHGVPCMALIDF